MADYEDFEPEDGGYEGEYDRNPASVYRRRRIVAAVIALLLIVLVVWGLVYAAQKITGSSDSGTAAVSSSQADNFASFSARPSGSAGASDQASGRASASGSASGKASGSASASPSGTSSSSGKASPSASATSKAAPAAAAPTSSAASTPAQPQTCSTSALQVSATVDKDSYASGQNPVLTAHVTNTGSDPCVVDLGSSSVSYNITSGSAQVFDSQTCTSSGAAQQKVTVAADGSKSTQITWPRQINALGCGDKASTAQPGYYWLTVTVNGVASEKKAILLK